VVLLLRPGTRRFLALHESSAHVSDCYKPGLLSCSVQWRARVGVQLLLITHSTAASDLAGRLVSGPDGVTEVYEGSLDDYLQRSF